MSTKIGRQKSRKRRTKSSTLPAESQAQSADESWRQFESQRRRRLARAGLARGLAWGTVVAFVSAVLTGVLRLWIWILALEPLALGFVIGEAAAVPSSARHRQPPALTYLFISLLAGTAYLFVHVVFWLASGGFFPMQSFGEFLTSAPSSTAVPFFQSVDLARQLALATGGATALKYWIWMFEGLLMSGAAVLAYRGGSVRKLKS